MKTFETVVEEESSLSAKVKEKEEVIEAPLGVGVGENAAQEDGSIGVKDSLGTPDVSVTRTSETHYSYTFQFSYDFSTSDGPFSAGHPSDVIVGGGIDVIVSEALEGD